MHTVFVTGSTGLLGNNLVRLLVARGYRVKALARSPAKAANQFAGVPVEIIEGDMANVAGFAAHLRGCEAVFHTAAFFRDGYKGGTHWPELYKINVLGTEQLLHAAYAAGIRKLVHTSSIAVLDGPPDALINETMERRPENADDYYRSKILSDQKVFEVLKQYPDLVVPLVLPGWMFGPGDIGPTSAGQIVLDFVQQKLPGRIPGAMSVVDARDVAAIQIAALERGRSGERYLAAGRALPMKDLLTVLQTVSGIPAPTRDIPVVFMRALAWVFELIHTLTGKPALVSRASVELLIKEAGRCNYDHSKTAGELGATFRPVAETMADVIVWYRQNGFLPHSPSSSIGSKSAAPSR